MAHERQATNQDLLNQIERLKTQKVPDNDIGLLKSRIEEQSHLIMILKQRADENLIRSKTLEKLNDELSLERTSLKNELEQEKVRSTRTEQQFATLKHTFDEVSRVNEQLKRDLEASRNDLSRARDDGAGRNALFAELREKNAQLERANAQIIEEQERYLELEERCRTLENELESRERTLAAECESLLSQKAALDSAIHDAYEKLEEASKRNEMLQEELQATRAELATYGRQRDVSAEGSAALQKQLETLANTNESLQREVAALRKQLTDAQAQHAREMGELVASASAKALQRKLEQAERRIYEMNLEYDAFKAHAKAQLEKEMTINQQLRYLLK